MSHHHHHETNPHFARLPSQNQHLQGGASTSQTSPHQPPIPSRKTPKSQKLVPGILIKPRGRHRETPIHEPSNSVTPLPLSPEDRLPPRETPNSGKKPVLLSPEERQPPRKIQHSKTRPVLLSPEDSLPPRKIQHSKTRPVLLSPEDSLPPRKTPNSATRPLLLSPEDHHHHDHQPQQRPPPPRGGYGSTLPPIPKPSPWRTGPTPSPRQRASGQRLPPPARETNAMTWSAAFCCAIFWVLLILAGLIVLIVYLIYRPRSPFVDISTANLNAAYLDMGFLLNGDLTILANFTNPNKKCSVEFSHVTFELYYYNTHIATQYIDPFKIPKKLSMFANVHLVSSQVQLQPTQSRELQRQIENGPVLLNLRGTFHARSNLGTLFRYSYWLHTHCSFSLNSPPAGALRARRCSTKR